MFTNDRNSYRQAFFIAWNKYKKKLPLETVESQLVEVILLHPEYHSLLDNPNQFHQQEFAMEENPFMHMSLHIALREQIRLNRPVGIKQIYDDLFLKNNMEAEHLMMTCLARMLFIAQQKGEMASDEEYLRELRLLG